MYIDDDGVGKDSLYISNGATYKFIAELCW